MFTNLQNIDWTDWVSVKDGFAGMELIPSLIAVIALIAVSFFAFKIFRIGVTAGVSFAGGILGYWLSGIILENFNITMPDGINLAPIMAFVFAIIGAILAICLYRIAVFAIGAGAGYFAGTIAASYLGAAGAGIEFFDGTAGIIIVGVVCALILAFIMFFFYKFLYILLTSVIPMAAAFAIVGFAVLPEYAHIFLVGGAVVGIIAMVYQYRQAEYM